MDRKTKAGGGYLSGADEDKVGDRKIARVFPRITKATPDDDMCFFGPPPLLTLPEIDEVHVSCVFTYDRTKAEELAYQWEVVGVPVKIGGSISLRGICTSAPSLIASGRSFTRTKRRS